MKKGAKISLAIFVLVLSLIVIGFLITGTLAENSGSSDEANLTIWDDTDSATKRSGWNVYFYANFTNSTGDVINLTNGNGNCTVRFNETGTWTNWLNMVYNDTSFLWEYNRTFGYKGVLNFSVNCTSNFGNITTSDDITITNSIPTISKEQSADWINFDGIDTNHDTWQCTEDIACYYNFSANVSDSDTNDVLSYSVGENTTLTNYTLNTTSGMLLINITHNNYTGTDKKIELKVKDNDPDALWQAALLDVDITAVNDIPAFSNLENKSFNMSELFDYIIIVTDEEDNIPFVFNITFLNCSTAEWSSRNSTNCTLFTESQYSTNSTSINISFIPTRNDVGSYIINFSVMDNSSLGNKTTSQIVNFTVLNVNSVPYFTYICDNERNTTEDNEFICYINVTDIDETNNLTLASNYTWFTFYNGSNHSDSITINCNIFTGYNVSAKVNFTATDTEVGNWSINITVNDNNLPAGTNSTIFWFFINNTEDSVSLDEIGNYTIYENKTIYVNATDDDLLVPDKNVKNESLIFGSNTSWVKISTYSSPSGVNYTTAEIKIDYDIAFSLYGNSNHTINVNVTDTAGNIAERNFTIQILGDNPPVWNETMVDVFVIYEDSESYFNFSENVTDADGDTINFSFANYTSFSSFNITAGGIINFTPIDEDVGYHNITINASDGKLRSSKSFNFTIYNINDIPSIEVPIQANSATVNNSNSNMNTTEDALVEIFLFVEDDDYKIPPNQKDFYNESLIINLTLQGPNSTLFEFSQDSSFPTVTFPNKTKYIATFTPKKSDVGNYNITINVTDSSNASAVLQFNLTIEAINHAPILMNLTNQTSAINRIFYFDINATDTEDVNEESGNLTFNITFLSGEDFIKNNETIFNTTSGVLNITFNSSYAGIYNINVTVNDSTGSQNSLDFWLFVYDYPNITFPLTSQSFSLQENITSNLTFQVNHSVGDNLTYEFYINNILKYNLSYYGNNTNLTWQFTPNFTDETYGEVKNLTLIVLNPIFYDVNTTVNWNITINHTNAPVVFTGYMGDKQVTYNQDIEINLSLYFSDTDFSDSAYNQTLNFTIISNASPSYISSSVSNWTLTLSSSTAVIELLTINATDLNDTNESLTSAVSNSFEVEFTTPATVTTPTPSTGGGGTTRPTLLKIILPDPVSAYKKDRIIIPITLSNDGQMNLYDINLASLIIKNNTIRKDITVSFDKTYFKSLYIGKKENVTMTIDIDTEEVGLYEITVNASVRNPKYHDWSKLYLTIKEPNKTEVLETIIFTEEFIAENPECIEIKEIVKEANKYYKMGDYTTALEKTREAIDSCRHAISQQALPTLKPKFGNDLYKYLNLLTLIVFVIGISYYIYKKFKFKRGLIK